MAMEQERPYTKVLERLKSAGLRPTRQRMALAKLLFDAGNRHVTAEQLHNEAGKASVRVSLATVYNTLHQFVDAGLLREVMVDPGRSYFDTNTADHHHFFDQSDGRLIDIADESISLGSIPTPPDGTAVDRVDVIIRVNKASE